MGNRREADGENFISDYLKKNEKKACELIDAIMTEMTNPEKLASTPLNQLSSVLGTVIDKFGAEENGNENGTLDALLGDFKDVK